MLPILVDGMKEVNGARVNPLHLHRFTPWGHALTARSALVGCAVVVLLGPYIAWLGGLARLAHQHADTVPIGAELHGEVALPAHSCPSVDNETTSLSVPLATCIAGKPAWQAGLAWGTNVPCCTPGLYCLPA